ncbi:MAG: hypothetical protein C0478_08290, partial [Planctomyces sp.]|nr:hypothetical protein [Planctomyces sp.]
MLSRRSLLEAAALGVAGLGTAGLTGSSQAVANNSPAMPASQEAAAQSAAGEREKLPPIHRFGRMLHDYHDGLIRRRMQARSEQLSTIDTREKALAYIGEVRKKILAAFGPFPERTPLNANITGSLPRDTYRIDKLLFESQPRFFVTANLYVPTVGPGPFPAVVGECGHAVNGKAYKSYQSFSQGLARQGYVVLIFDPVSQGERIQYGAEDPAKSQIGIGVLEHLHEGNQQFLVGD